MFTSKDADARKAAEARRLIWMKMKHIWDDLYFCARDDIVFTASDPATYVASNQMIEWLMNRADRI